MQTTISLSKDLKEQLGELRNLGDTYEDVIRRMYELTSKHLLLTYLYDESDSLTIVEVKKELTQ